MGDYEELFILCICHSPQHQILFRFFPNGDPEPNNELYITVHLEQHRNILKRTWSAIRYILGYKSQYGDWDEIILNKDKAGELGRFLTRYQRS